MVVSNLGQGSGGNAGLEGAWQAQKFTTGSDDAFLSLESIEVQVSIAMTPPGRLRAELWSVDNGNPDSKIVSLTVPGTLPTGNVAFTAPPNTTLAAATDYFFVLYPSDTLTTGKASVTFSDNEDAGRKPGWSIANDRKWRAGTGSTTNISTVAWLSNGNPLKIRINSREAQSSNANLSGLTASTSTSSGGTYSALDIGTFSASTTSYTATVAGARTHVKLTPTVEDTGKATVAVRKGTTGIFTAVTSGSASGAIALGEGSNAITVRVTAQDTTTTKDYTVTITRQPAEPTLTGLSLSAGGSTVTLSPAFAGTTTNYTATVPHDATSVSATATWTATARVEVSAYDPVRQSVLTNYEDNPISSSGGSATVNLASSGNTRVNVRATRTDVANNPPARVYRIVVSKEAPPPTVSLSASPNPVGEGASVTITATLSAALSSAVTIPLTLTDGTADAGDRGTLAGITINSGSTSGTGTISTNQDADTDDETFTVALGNLPASVTAGSPSSVQVTIRDDDSGAVPAVSLSAAPNPVGEGASVTVTARLSAALGSAVTIPLTLTDGTADTGDRGTLAGITINSGSTSGTGTISTNQDADTDDETFTVALGNLPASVTAGSPSTVVITIDDDDSPPIDPPIDPPPGGDPAGIGQFELPPGPLKLALWTDRSSYRPGQQLRLYRSLDPRRLPDEHAVLLYLQRVGSEQRTYLALHANGDQLRSEPADQFGHPEGAFFFGVPATVDRQQTWQGPAPLQPGLWQFVMELHSRSESSEPKRIWAKFMVGPGRVLNRRGFQREVTQELTLTGDRVHYLLHRLVVRPGATLRLQAGALLRAHGPSAEIVVEPGGRIVAEGTRQAPVVLTCSAPVGQRAAGCWGGLRIHGRAPITGGEGAAADGDAWYDSSGSLSYLRVEFAGGSPQQDTAAPALALHRVGFGTLMQHVQVRSSAGDGIAFLGGAVRCDYCVASDSGGHGLSWQRGFRGSLRHLYVWQGSGDGDAVHGRNLDSGPDRQPRSHPVLANVTLTVTAPWRAGKGAGLRLQAGSALTATRLLVLGFSRSAALVADPRAAQLFEDGTSAVTDSIQFRNLRAHRGWNGAGVKFRTHAALTLRNADTDPNHDPRPKRLQEVLLDSHGEAAYIGAFGEENWLEEWTVFGPESEYDLRERSEDEN